MSRSLTAIKRKHYFFMRISVIAILLYCLLFLPLAQADESRLIVVEKNISAQTSKEIALFYVGKPFPNFKNFVIELYFSGGTFFSEKQRETLGEFAAGQQLSKWQQHIIFRLLGIYAQLKYGGDALNSLGQLVAIPSYHQKGIAQHQNPHFKNLERVISALASNSNLHYRNIDGRVYEISFKSKPQANDNNRKLIALHAHADVVPANPDNWGLEGGIKLEPFRMTRIGDHLYGRGTQDDKNAIVAAIYAMRIIQEENIPLFHDFKLLIDTTEETTSTAIPYYFERNPMPDFNLALDGAYPVVIAEKGFGVVSAIFPIRQAAEGDFVIVSVTGGLAYNQIPATSQATITTQHPVAVTALLNRLGQQFIAMHGDDFSISARLDEPHSNQVLLTLKGVSAHSSEPESGINPVSRMLLFIDYVKQTPEILSLRANHITDAAAYATQLWGLDYFGKQFGIAFEHAFMGPMTAAFTKIDRRDNGFEVAVNLRIPVGRKLLDLERQIQQKVANWLLQNKVKLTLNIRMKEPMYRDPQGPWVNALLDIAAENLNLPRQFESSAGGTSIHNLPNGVQFGLSMPNEKYTGHNANEFKSLDQFLLDLQIVTEMIVRVGFMREL